MSQELGAEARELKIAQKNRRLLVLLAAFAFVLMTASFVLMKAYHFVPTPPK